MNEKIVDASNQRQRERAAEMQKNTSGMRTAACGMRTAACGMRDSARWMRKPRAGFFFPQDISSK